MLSRLQLRNFRCFPELVVDFQSEFNFLIGRNGEGKTSILEAACVVLRLQSQRSSTLMPLVRLGTRSFAVAGDYSKHRLEFRYSALRRKISFDGLEQRNASEYLRLAPVVSFANSDIELVRAVSEPRRRYLDFLGAQTDERYRPTLRVYERALRSRNALLKAASMNSRELAAYEPPLLEHGANLAGLRNGLVEQLTPLAAAAYREISGKEESLQLRYLAGTGDDFAAELARSRPRELRLRQTVVGPHRDDLELRVDGMPASQYASEGQQRTVVLALKIAQARVFAHAQHAAPLLLLDDIFGELDATRRNLLLKHLPGKAQKLVTATSMQWLEQPLEGPVFHLESGNLQCV
ncbi:MAG: DNA replication and repair protein RecF [Chthoniobacterales bacterium]